MSADLESYERISDQIWSILYQVFLTFRQSQTKSVWCKNDQNFANFQPSGAPSQNPWSKIINNLICVCIKTHLTKSVESSIFKRKFDFEICVSVNASPIPFPSSIVSFRSSMISKIFLSFVLSKKILSSNSANFKIHDIKYIMNSIDIKLIRFFHYFSSWTLQKRLGIYMHHMICMLKYLYYLAWLGRLFRTRQQKSQCHRAIGTKIKLGGYFCPEPEYCQQLDNNFLPSANPS